jgi:tRNA(Met) cytidine acetyltransferase
MCADDHVFEHCHAFFLQRLIKHLQDDPSVYIYQQAQPLTDQRIMFDLPTAPPQPLPTPDQLDALVAIGKVAKGHRYRPLVLHADRGRGKSSVLGIAAARIFIEHGYSIAITAPDQQTCQAAFLQYRRRINDHFNPHHSNLQHTKDSDTLASALAAFQFMPIDQLLEQSSQFHLIMVDEAAALPTPLLHKLLKQHPRLVFATTVHGYEGNGQGFAIRFKQTLDNITPHWKAVSLQTPVRWLDNDPLERWFFRFLLLNASLNPVSDTRETKAKNLITLADKTDTSVHVHWLSQAMLAEDESLFESAFSLLVSAHYQTKPSDIRLILDHPAIHIAIAVRADTSDQEPAQPCGVILLLEEGGLSADLADELIAGNRRPRGHLFPQALCASSGNAEFLRQRSYRITRIAVSATVRDQGIGSALLSAARHLARKNHIDSLSTSFGLRPELLSFWHKNQFDSVKLGLHTDGSSGSQSIMLMSPLTEAAKALCEQASAAFNRYFLFNLSRLYQHLSYENCLAVIKAMTFRQTRHCDADTQTMNPLTIHKLRAFACGYRSFEETNQNIYDFVLASLTSSNLNNVIRDKLANEDLALLVMKVLQGHNNLHCEKHLGLKGKKVIDQQLRTALRILMAC